MTVKVQSTWDYLREGSPWVRIQKAFWLAGGWAAFAAILCAVLYVVGQIANALTGH